jgi:hypothetical protein
MELNQRFLSERAMLALTGGNAYPTMAKPFY